MVPEKGNERIKKSDFSNRSCEFPGQKYVKNMTFFRIPGSCEKFWLDRLVRLTDIDKNVTFV